MWLSAAARGFDHADAELNEAAKVAFSDNGLSVRTTVGQNYTKESRLGQVVPTRPSAAHLVWYFHSE